MNQLFTDLQKVDLSIFSITSFASKLVNTMRDIQSIDGLRLAPTERILVFKNGPSRLYYYGKNSLNSITDDQPIIFLVPSLINRPFIFDLIPNRSFIEYLVQNGIGVFMMDWGTPEQSDSHVPFEDYIFNYYHEAVLEIKSSIRRDSVAILGYCIGGTLSMVYAGLYPKNVQALVNLASPIDFYNGGILRRWVDESGIDLEKIIRANGNIPPEFMYLVFSMLKPTSKTTAFRMFFEKYEDRDFSNFHRAMEYWTSSNVPFPGKFGLTYILDFYTDNRLLKNNLVYYGKEVDLKKYKNPLLNILSDLDHIVPPESALASEKLVGSELKESWIYSTGHVGLLVSSFSIKKIWPRFKDWLYVHGKKQSIN